MQQAARARAAREVPEELAGELPPILGSAKNGKGECPKKHGRCARKRLLSAESRIVGSLFNLTSAVHE
tara:strand:+ start:150 stop:353 length:204 start_codon:yes stop_codon:yes gene_type:complete